MAEIKQPVKLAGSTLTDSCHACAFFHSQEEKYRVLMPFIKEGFENGDRAFHIVNPDDRAKHLERLEHEGIDTAEAQAKGLLEVLHWRETYIKDGRFDQELMTKALMDAIGSCKTPPGKISRNIASMEWALEDLPGVHNIVEYESRLNQVLPKDHDPVVCTYDLSQFDAATVMDILRTHPMVIIGSILQENPFYVPPEEMLKELAARANAQ
jgi:hypothetical protein